MAALRREPLLTVLASLLRAKPATAAHESKRARDFANHVYKKSGGVTPDMRKLYASLLENERRSSGT